MKNIFLLLVVMTTYFYTAAQNVECGTDELHQYKMDTDPEYKKNVEKVNKKIYDIVRNKTEQTEAHLPILTIPVVVHVMNLGEDIGAGSNLSLERIEAGIQHLNDAFRNVGDYAGDPIHTNAGIPAADVEIEFCLAVRDPEGNPTNGVNRVETPYSNLSTNLPCVETTPSTQNACMKALSFWDSNDYLNVWLVNKICWGSQNNCGVIGYATSAWSHGGAYDGVVCESRFWGLSPKASKVQVHEVGHYLNLDHTFYRGCSETDCLLGGDRVCDTPPDAGTSGGDCRNNETINTCSNDATITNSPFTTDVEDIYENYMDYGFFTQCVHSFTPGQKDRMRAALTGVRSSLLSSDGCIPVPVAPVADLYANKLEACNGAQIKYTDNSAGIVTERVWTFPGGTPSTSTAESPIVTYSTEGAKDASLLVSNVYGNNTKLITDYVNILYFDREVVPSTHNESVETPSGLGIINVTLEDIDNRTFRTYQSGTAFEDFACAQLAHLEVGESYAIAITAGKPSLYENAKAWIDFNGDKVIDEVNEEVFSGENLNGTPLSQVFTVPAYAVRGERILLRVSSDIHVNTPSLSASQRGQIEDYGIWITEEALPLNWLSFNAIPSEKNIQLDWRTIDEVDNEIFEIERMIENGMFKKIGAITPRNLATENQYRFIDEKVIANQNYYYRIKQIDLDGTFTYSRTRVAKIKSNHNDISIYPNPSSTHFYIRGVNAQEVKNVVVYNAIGQKIPINLIESGAVLGFNLDKNSDGIYWTSIELESGHIHTCRIVKN